MAHRRNRVQRRPPFVSTPPAHQQAVDWEPVWIGGTYDTELAKTRESWKFTKVMLRPRIMSPFSDGWSCTRSGKAVAFPAPESFCTHSAHRL